MTEIITCFGYSGSGKSELADFVEEYGICSASMGDILRHRFEIAVQNGLVKRQV